ncbi:replicative DNA helicase [Bacillus sp. M6-12]|uniref:replicative DNA helicase n=1 Tax=Bacillus sp. M6-12 TaxID=2054166 RepID=UPI000C78C24B|nr:replicative DNA helicase [Bacillus sp. M6-12]PLS18710.1 replicative DNA helicase [Bacillus sp. M6-12]
MQFEFANVEAEQALVGSLFLEVGLIQECTIQPNQLYTWQLRKLLEAMKQLHDMEKPIDVISVVEQIGPNNLKDIGGIGFITDLAGSVPTTANFHYYQDIVKEYDQKRKTIQAATLLMEEAKTNEIRKTLRDGIHRLMQIEDQSTEDSLGEIQASLIDFYYDCENDIGELSGIPSGFTQLDKLTGGFQASDLVIIGARPGMGKTAFALNLALTAAKEDIAIFFSLEMPVKQLMKRAISATGKINGLKLRNPKKNLSKEDWTKLTEAMGKISKANLHMFDRAAITVSYIWAKVRKVKREYGEKKRILVVLDYLQLISGEGKQCTNRYAEISEISRSLKQMAKELDVVVLALSQLSRGVEVRQEKRPILSDLRESGQIEQDADVIAFLYREDYYQKGTEHKDITEIIVAKQRNGPIGTVKLGFEKEYGRFGEV